MWFFIGENQGVDRTVFNVVIRANVHASRCRRCPRGWTNLKTGMCPVLSSFQRLENPFSGPHDRLRAACGCDSIHVNAI